MDDPIEGKIADILDEFTVVINKGSNDGVKAGQVFIIYEEGVEIFDGEKSLGRLEIVKGKVKVKSTQDKMSVCESYKIEYVRSPSVLEMISGPSLLNQETKKVLVPLNVDEEYKKKFEGSKKIKVEDLVKQEI